MIYVSLSLSIFQEAIRDRVQVSFAERLENPHSTELVFRCRFFKSSESDALQPATGDRFLQRGMAASKYAEYYKNYIGNGKFSSGGDASTGQSIYSKAIQNLHISVVPDELPCREDQRRDIQDHIRQFISGRSSSASIYISGLPGKMNVSI